MNKTWLTALLSAAALGTTTPAFADNTDRCERKLERIEERFREIETRRGWEAASDWWNEHAWPKYFARCGA